MGKTEQPAAGTLRAVHLPCVAPPGMTEQKPGPNTEHLAGSGLWAPTLQNSQTLSAVQTEVAEELATEQFPSGPPVTRGRRR